MSQITLQLGDFLFEGFEIPESISPGGSHRLVTHQLPGGGRVIDSLGRDDSDLTWSGIFLGEFALDRATYIDSLRIAGGELPLLWSGFNYTVIVSEYHYKFERAYKLPYSITCKVVKDNAKPNTTYFPAGFDAAITGDSSASLAFGVSINDGPLSGLLTTLDSAISAVSTFAGAAQSVINSVLTPLAAVQARVAILVTTVSSTVNSVTTLGGVIPNNPVAQSANSLVAQVSALNKLPQLYNLQSTLNRLGGNLSLIKGVQGGQTITQSGGNLFAVAQKYYGDATKWATIALANNIVDPQLVGLNTLKIPANPPVTDGLYVK